MLVFPATSALTHIFCTAWQNAHQISCPCHCLHIVVGCVNLFNEYTENVRSVLLEEIKRDAFSAAKFDNRPELLLIRIMETT